MQILIRHIHRDRKGREELLEEVVENPVITVGHGGDQVVQLRDPAVAQRHLELKAASDGRFHFRTFGGTRVLFRGESRNRGTLEVGEQLELGEQTITVGEPAAGFDAALEVTVVALEEEVGPATHFRTQLSQTGLGTRKTAWALFVGILVLFLVVPMTGYVWPDLGSGLRGTAMLPSDRSWSSGPLSNVHHTPEIGENCNTCHLELFERAPDRGCLECHDGVSAHVDRERVSVPHLENTRCASCHAEHNEPPALVRNESGLCVDCHRDPGGEAELTGEGELPDAVSGFSASAHPAFRLAMLRQTGLGGDWRTERVERSTRDLAETSHLKFPHDIHLDPEKVESLRTGEPLDCASCHQLREGGEHFVPITMERTCRGCHSLSFDDDFPRKQLPHGDVQAAIVALEEHFIRKYADPELRQDGRQRGRRRPGRTDEAERCQGTPLECGRRLAQREAANQFTRSGCVTCHEVSEDPERPMEERWRVRQVRLDEDWYPFGRFDHVAHLTRSRDGREGETACLACHSARQSDAASDILIPGQDNCLQCHGQSGETTVELTCRGCHEFHLPFRTAMKEVGEDADTSVDRSVAQADRGENDE